ncbi:MAG: DUF4384 domain-containing protein [Acidobacteriota bacterium]
MLLTLPRASALALALIAPQTAPPAKPAPVRAAVKIELEKKSADGKVNPIASDHVFTTGDQIRLRITSDFDGFLYVMVQGSSGSFRTAFPAPDAGNDNHVTRGQAILIPSNGDWFEVDGPPGFDTLYFLLSPEPIVTPSANAFVAPGPISSLKPRCNDTIFRARGECTDANAGPAALPKDAPLPAPLQPIAGAASRDITVVKKKDSVTVGASTSKVTTGPVVYTFRLAHR